MRYEPGSRFYDEMFTALGAARAHYQGVETYLDALGVEEFRRRHQLLDLAFRNQGITFTVYGDAQGTERTFPFDPVPRIIPAIRRPPVMQSSMAYSSATRIGLLMGTRLPIMAIFALLVW